MEISQITAFLAVAEELHFGRAAQRLHSAQPPLSRTIRQLEKQLGATLFERNTRNVRLTSAGEALLGPAREILDACRLAEIAVAAAGRGQVGRVRIGFAGVSSHLLIGRWAKLVRHTHPGIEFVLDSSAFASEALNKLLDGTLDIGLVRWIFTPPGIASRVILNEDFVVALPTDHPLAGRDGVRIEELATEPWVTLPADPGSALRDSLQRAAHDAGFTPRIVQSAPDSMALMALVSAEVGCALTVSSVAENVNNPDVVFLPLVGGPSTLQLRIAWRADDDNAALREVLRLSEEALPTPE
ncbi:LysR family transcriptional regulator [Rhodococcus opacus PD630]|uniref:LysR family transcriptional regulator n=1 Tax=Rhodococcus opacus TaxID=37919 RepID=A0A2S8IQC0_RHOOP|nr:MULTISPECIES: LysR family transcriptional regulator [Rhodococcus]KXF54967.1 LysR family transcriptional regulator [Rhodococcus sp. SC4]NDV08668.1 LysR family transcriptional regulator [Rhodococcus sp. IEGM 248]RZK75294.1 MAG: LysR family transcriptional regulator [Rhodococcus sp. (in: high G+C Gram-positive bacteria)]AHK28032.1 HTH-type transcriptional regulator AlsR [Rhodococcus opacus PD630]EHI41747.1 LysR family transcriptional regulator [Rhodococcus opacus PD630]